MTGQVHWFPFIVLAIAVTPVIAFGLYNWYANRRFIIENCSVRCRGKGNILVQCSVVRDAKTGEPIGIRGCTANANPEDVRCNRDCLPLLAHHKAA